MKVSVIMGSQSDLKVMENCMDILKEMDISYEVRILSAHRTPEETQAYAENLVSRGTKVVIAAAGGAAHLAGVIAGNTVLPVIGVPMETSNLGGIDSLLSTVQMPKGIPVATVAIGKSGAINAALLATSILATADPIYFEKLLIYRKKMQEEVLKNTFVEEYKGTE